MKPYYCLLILLLLFGPASQAQLQNQVSLEPEVETTEKSGGTQKRGQALHPERKRRFAGNLPSFL